MCRYEIDCDPYASLSVIDPHLERQVGILMHPKDLRVVDDGKTLDELLVLLQFLRVGGVVDP